MDSNAVVHWFFLWVLFGWFKVDLMSFLCPPSVPVPPAGILRITDVTHSTMKLNWDAAPGEVSKYMITYKPEEGDVKEVPQRFCLSV